MTSKKVNKFLKNFIPCEKDKKKIAVSDALTNTASVLVDSNIDLPDSTIEQPASVLVDSNIDLPDSTIQKKTRKRRSVRWQLNGVYETEKDVKQMLENTWKHLKFQCEKQYFKCIFATTCKTRKSFD